MTADAPGRFRAGAESVVASFKYRVVAGAVTSPTYESPSRMPPRVTRIDVDYTYPDGLSLAPRTEAGRRRHLRAGRHRRAGARLHRPARRRPGRWRSATASRSISRSRRANESARRR